MAVGSVLVSAHFWRRAERAESRIVELSDRFARQQQLLDVLREPGIEVVQLRSAHETAAARGKVIWGESGHGLLELSRIPATPPGKVYQLWVYPRDREPWSAAVFEVADATSDRLFRLDDFAPGPRSGLRGFALTVEDPGTTIPKGDLLLGARIQH